MKRRLVELTLLAFNTEFGHRTIQFHDSTIGKIRRYPLFIIGFWGESRSESKIMATTTIVAEALPPLNCSSIQLRDSHINIVIWFGHKVAIVV